MFRRIRLRLKDMKTLIALGEGAKKHANLGGDEKVGAEHYVLSALELPDGSASRVFHRLGISAEDYCRSIEDQYKAALDAVGISAGNTPVEPIAETGGLVHVKGSGSELMKSLHALKQTDKDRALLGAHVLTVVGEMKHGAAIRAFRALGIDSSTLNEAIQCELGSAG